MIHHIRKTAGNLRLPLPPEQEPAESATDCRPHPGLE
jgi:hypothetical protein